MSVTPNKETCLAEDYGEASVPVKWDDWKVMSFLRKEGAEFAYGVRVVRASDGKKLHICIHLGKAQIADPLTVQIVLKGLLSFLKETIDDNRC